MRESEGMSLNSGSCLPVVMRCVLLLVCCASLAQARAERRAEPDATEKTLTIHLANAPIWFGDLDAMIERRAIRVLTVNDRMFYFVDKGVQRGVVVDAFRIYEKELNARLSREGRLDDKNLPVRVVFIPVHHDALLTGLTSGLGDIAAANLTVTTSRRATVDFARAGLRDVTEMVVTGPRSPRIRTLEDLSGQSVFVRQSSSYYDSVLRLNAQFKAEGKAPVRIDLAPETLDDNDLLEMLNAGMVNAIVADKHIAELWGEVFRRIVIHPSLVLREGAQVAWALRKDSPELKASLDDFSARNEAGTRVGNRLLNRYLTGARYVKDNSTPEERQRFEGLRRYFQKYGLQYRIDWLLMAAQGYQESQFNQEARSPAGAIGVMQLMPATGQDMNVGDITEIEANIHAGIKYMRWMVDKYFETEPMSPLDKVLFSLAAYNAGPGRVAGMRKEAAERGLNPNVWFKNVEYVAADLIGNETVSYVSNIYKYFIGYRLALQVEEDAKADLGSFGHP